jgi:SAM-dependent methyltransferase
VNHADHLALLRDGVGSPAPGSVWADLGAGGGAFTLALAELLGPDATLYAVDRDARALRGLERDLRGRYPATRARTLCADFTRPLGLPPLDGIVSANALHFVPERQQGATLELLWDALTPGGRLLVVEYNAARGNRWVPYPRTSDGWAALAEQHGFVQARRVAGRPSRFLNEIATIASRRPLDNDITSDASSAIAEGPG